MAIVPEDIRNFLESQSFLVVSTFDSAGGIHSSIKGIAGTEEDKVYIIDLFKGRTYNNVKNNPTITITAVDEHLYKGYSLKGKGYIVPPDKIPRQIIKVWEKKVIRRISKRVIKNIKEERKSSRYPEATFGPPQHLIVMVVEEIADLS